MRSTRIRTTVAASATAAALTIGTLTGLTHGAGDASAQYNRPFPLSNCFGLSPNIVDVPFMPPGVNVSEYGGFTTVTATFSSLWLGVGYDSHAKLTWQHLGNGKRGTLHSSAVTRPPNTGVLGFNFPKNQPGKGRVKVTLSAVNSNALWSIPAQSCSGVIEVP